MCSDEAEQDQLWILKKATHSGGSSSTPEQHAKITIYWIAMSRSRSVCTQQSFYDHV
jgi:hypothetical protein